MKQADADTTGKTQTEKPQHGRITRIEPSKQGPPHTSALQQRTGLSHSSQRDLRAPGSCNSFRPDDEQTAQTLLAQVDSPQVVFILNRHTGDGEIGRARRGHALASGRLYTLWHPAPSPPFTASGLPPGPAVLQRRETPPTCRRGTPVSGQGSPACAGRHMPC